MGSDNGVRRSFNDAMRRFKNAGASAGTRIGRKNGKHHCTLTSPETVLIRTERWIPGRVAWENVYVTSRKSLGPHRTLAPLLMQIESLGGTNRME